MTSYEVSNTIQINSGNVKNTSSDYDDIDFFITVDLLVIVP